MWADRPDKAGYWLFKGKRISLSEKFTREVLAAVEVRDNQKFPDLVVYYPGNGNAYELAKHEGEWFYLGDMLNG